MSGVWKMTHAATFTNEACRLYAGPYAAKRMARAIRCSVSACEQYLANRRRLSLDAAIELAAADERAEAALFARIETVRTRNAATRMRLDAARAAAGLDV
jgi:hypothetical protein